MRTINQYDLSPGQQELPLPLNSRLLSVACQHGSQIVAYAEVETDETRTEAHTLHVYPTGGPVAHNGGAVKFLGTVEMAIHGYWFHVYHTAPKGAAVTTTLDNGATLTEDEKGLLITQKASPEMVKWMNNIKP